MEAAGIEPRRIPCMDVCGRPRRQGRALPGPPGCGRPRRAGQEYSEAGADELVLLDIATTVEGRDTLAGLVRRVAERVAIPFTVGGGVRTVGDAETLLEAGADKVAVNSAALARPELLTVLVKRLGSQAVVLAVDASGDEVRSHAGSRPAGRGAAEWAREGEEQRAGEILLTSINGDGTRDGYDLELTREVADAVSVPVIASGGAGPAEHVAAALEAAQAALLASILHENPARLVELRTEPRGLGVPLRDAA
ncbi:MAG: imidazole glycerol phosphate synthase subunit HisF [Gaiellaceae bacterium]